MIRACLKEMWIADLLKMSLTSKTLQSLAMAEIQPLVLQELNVIVGDSLAFMGLLEVRSSHTHKDFT